VQKQFFVDKIWKFGQILLSLRTFAENAQQIVMKA